MKLFRLLRRRLLFLIPILAIIGPGIIAGNADNDAGGITTYSVAGANFGLSLLWVFTPNYICSCDNAGNWRQNGIGNR